MSRVILPGEAQRAKGGLQIHLPRSVREQLEREQERIGACLVCGARFYRGQETTWTRHVGECARANMDRLIAESPRTLMPILQPEAWDPEIEAHMRKLGKKMTAEDRLEVKPHERAGF